MPEDGERSCRAHFCGLMLFLLGSAMPPTGYRHNHTTFHQLHISLLQSISFKHSLSSKCGRVVPPVVCSLQKNCTTTILLGKRDLSNQQNHIWVRLPSLTFANLWRQTYSQASKEGARYMRNKLLWDVIFLTCFTIKNKEKHLYSCKIWKGDLFRE